MRFVRPSGNLWNARSKRNSSNDCNEPGHSAAEGSVSPWSARGKLWRKSDGMSSAFATRINWFASKGKFWQLKRKYVRLIQTWAISFQIQFSRQLLHDLYRVLRWFYPIHYFDWNDIDREQNIIKLLIALFTWMVGQSVGVCIPHCKPAWHAVCRLEILSCTQIDLLHFDPVL